MRKIGKEINSTWVILLRENGGMQMHTFAFRKQCFWQNYRFIAHVIIAIFNINLPCNQNFSGRGTAFEFIFRFHRIDYV